MNYVVSMCPDLPYDGPMLLRVGEAAKRANVSRATVRRWYTQGRIPVVKFGYRVLRIDEDDLDFFVQAQKTRRTPGK
jgi:excisionase family DNA binding protein